MFFIYFYFFRLIDTICNEWYLVNIVENDFVFGNIFAVFEEYFKQTIDDENEFKNISKILQNTHVSQQNIMYTRSMPRVENGSCNTEDINSHNNDNNNNENNPYLDSTLLQLSKLESKENQDEQTTVKKATNTLEKTN